MSKGFGRRQREVIAFLEKQPYAYSSEIIEGIVKHRPITKQEKDNIYDVITRLKRSGVLKEDEMHSLRKGTEEWRYKFPKPKLLSLNKENERYKDYNRLKPPLKP